MRTITVFDDGTNYTLRWLRALVWAEKSLRYNGVKVDFYKGKTLIPRRLSGNKGFDLHDLESAAEKAKKFDIVFLAFHNLSKFYQSSNNEIIAVLQKIKAKCRLLVWLDTSDSTGTTRFQFLPYVDLYLKKQILKDRDLYLTPFWGGRIHCDYYHKMLGIGDPEVEVDSGAQPLKEEEKDKIRLSWNVGCGDLFSGDPVKQIFHPYNYANYTFCPPGSKKDIDIHFRGSAWSPVAGYQRQKIIELLSGAEGLKIPDVTKKVPHDEYVRELKSAKAICSPFGWGEICTRDFEAFLYGATLVKPDMSHLETFPDWYVENETYVPIKWDFSDFNDLLDHLKAHDKDKEYTEIAVNGQHIFEETMMTEKGRQLFARHLIKQLGI